MAQWKLQEDAHTVELMYYKNSNIKGACSQVQHKYKRTQEDYDGDRILYQSLIHI